MQELGSKIWNFIEMAMRVVLIKWLRMTFLEKHWELMVQIVRFGLVGVSNVAVSYITYIIFLFLGCYYVVANIIGFVVSVTTSFLLSDKYVFAKEEGTKRTWWKTYIKTFTSYAGTELVLANILLVVWVQVLHISEVIAPVISLIITVPMNFVLNKFWAYRSEKKG